MSEEYEQFLEGNYDSGKEEEQRKRDIAQAQRINNTAQSLRTESRENLINMTLGDELLPAGDEEAIRELINEYALDKDNYLVDGAILTCNKATTKVQVIQGVPYGYGLSEKDENRKVTLLAAWRNASEINGRTVATVKDHEVNNNIEPFQCNCIYLPDRDSEIQAILSDMENCKKYGTCRALMRLEDDWENTISSTYYLSFNHSIGGQETERAQGITMNSMLFCRHGGIITPITSGQYSIEQYNMKQLLISKNSTALTNTTLDKAHLLTARIPGDIQKIYKASGLIYFDQNGYQRVRNTGLESDPYLVALGAYYANAAHEEGVGYNDKYCYGYGAIFKVTFSSGKEIYVTMGDAKDPIDTAKAFSEEGEHFYAGDNNQANTLEFICNYENKDSNYKSDNMESNTGTDRNWGKALTITEGASITSIELLTDNEIDWERYKEQNE